MKNLYRLALIAGLAILCHSTPARAQCTGTTTANKFCAGPPSGGAGQFRPRAMVAADLLIGSATQAWDADLDCIAAISSSGIITRTGAGTCTARSVTGTANEITVTNPAGTAGNIILSLPAALTFTGKTVTGGSYSGGAFTGAVWDNGAIGGTTPGAGSFTALKATQTLNIGGVITPAQITADQNNYSPTGFATATVLRLDTNASRSITGIAARADGDVIIVQNIGASDLKLLNESASSTAANRLAIFADATLNPNTSTALRYDATSQRWRSLAGAGTGGGGGGGVSQVIIAAGTGINVSGTCTITSIGTCTINLTTPVSAANGGTGVASPTANTVPINQGASAQTSIALTKGQCLAGDGSSVPTAATGCRVLLGTYTASASATLSDATIFSTTTFSDYEIVFENILPATLSSNQLQLQVFSGGAYQTTGYLSGATWQNASAAVGAVQSTTFIGIGASSGTIGAYVSPGINGTLRVHQPAATTQPKAWYGSIAIFTSSFGSPNQIGGMWNSNGAVTGFRIQMGTGNITSGVMKVYGIM